MGYDPHVDPMVQQIQAMQAQMQRLAEAAVPPPPPEINLTITLPPLDLHVSNDVQPTPVHVSNDVRPANTHVQAAAPPTVRVNVPATPGAREITFERNDNGQITGASVTERG